MFFKHTQTHRKQQNKKQTKTKYEYKQGGKMKEKVQRLI